MLCLFLICLNSFNRTKKVSKKVPKLGGKLNKSVWVPYLQRDHYNFCLIWIIDFSFNFLNCFCGNEFQVHEKRLMTYLLFGFEHLDMLISAEYFF